jgi:hypothetical protein
LNASVSYNGVALSQSRLDQIQNASTLDEAQRMGLFDRLKDFFRGGVKQEAIRQAFEALRAPSVDESEAPARHEGLLLHFGNLRNALRSDQAQRCDVQVTVDREAGTWSYQMHIDNQTLIKGSNLPIGSGYTLAAFQDHVMLTNLGDYLTQQYDADPADEIKSLQEQLREMNLLHHNNDILFSPSVTLEKMRVITQRLEALGAPSNAFPSFSLSSNLDSAELLVGSHSVMSCPISTRAELTEALLTKAMVGAHTVNVFLTNRDDDAEIRNTVQDMVDGETEQAALRQKLDDPFFSGAHFVSTEIVPNDSSKFTATFRDPKSGREETLVLSNRGATNGELRGDRLREKLAAGNYGSLSECIAQDLGTPRDPQVIYFTNVVRNELKTDLGRLTEEGIGEQFEFDTDEAVESYMQTVQQSVAPLTVGKTTLGELWGWRAETPPTPESPLNISQLLELRV